MVRGDSVLIKKSGLVIRNMKNCPNDFKLMVQWLNEPHVSEFYGKPLDLDEVIEKYLPRINEDGKIVPCIIEYDGSSLGYLQFYQLTETQKLELTLSPNIPTCGLDLFIGTPHCLNQGIGTMSVMAMLEYLMEIGIRRVVLDPLVDNARAIRCYEKCGFRKQRILSHHQLYDGVYLDSWLMEKNLGNRNDG